MRRQREQPERRQTASPRRARADLGQVLLAVILVSLAFAFILGMIAAGGGGPERQALALEEARAIQPLKIASKLTGYVIFGIVAKIGAAVMLGYVVFYVIAIGRNWLDLRARQVYAKDGLFPVIELTPGALYDPNRDNAGAHPLITLEALAVQKTAALKADKILVRQTAPAGRALEALPLEAGDDTPALPDLVRLADLATAPTLAGLVLGLGDSGPLTASLHDLMHVLAVGASGFGKSAFLRALVWQLAQVPEDLHVVAIDINGSEFNPLRDWARLLYPVARDTGAAIATLQAVGQEIGRRKELFEAFPAAYDLASYNRAAGDPLPPIVILADEATNLLNQSGLGDPLREVTQTARQYGVYLLLAGQSANSQVISTQTRDNFSTRLCFHTSPTSRRVVLGESVADVTQKGRAWAQLSGETLQQIQVPFVTREELARVLTRGKPARVLDLEARPTGAAPVTLEDPHAARVRALKAEGASDTRIAREVYGHGNPHYIDKVRAILQQQQHGATA